MQVETISILQTFTSFTKPEKIPSQRICAIKMTPKKLDLTMPNFLLKKLSRYEGLKMVENDNYIEAPNLGWQKARQVLSNLHPRSALDR